MKTTTVICLSEFYNITDISPATQVSVYMQFSNDWLGFRCS